METMCAAAGTGGAESLVAAGLLRQQPRCSRAEALALGLGGVERLRHRRAGPTQGPPLGLLPSQTVLGQQQKQKEIRFSLLGGKASSTKQKEPLIKAILLLETNRITELIIASWAAPTVVWTSQARSRLFPSRPGTALGSPGKVLTSRASANSNQTTLSG